MLLVYKNNDYRIIKHNNFYEVYEGTGLSRTFIGKHCKYSSARAKIDLLVKRKYKLKRGV